MLNGSPPASGDVGGFLRCGCATPSGSARRVSHFDSYGAPSEVVNMDERMDEAYHQ